MGLKWQFRRNECSGKGKKGTLHETNVEFEDVLTTFSTIFRAKQNRQNNNCKDKANCMFCTKDNDMVYACVKCLISYVETAELYS